MAISTSRQLTYRFQELIMRRITIHVKTSSLPMITINNIFLTNDCPLSLWVQVFRLDMSMSCKFVIVLRSSHYTTKVCWSCIVLFSRVWVFAARTWLTFIWTCKPINPSKILGNLVMESTSKPVDFAHVTLELRTPIQTDSRRLKWPKLKLFFRAREFRLLDRLFLAGNVQYALVNHRWKVQAKSRKSSFTTDCVVGRWHFRPV